MGSFLALQKKKKKHNGFAEAEENQLRLTKEGIRPLC